MDIKPIVLTELERQTRKVQELRKRGYDAVAIGEAMGLSPTRLAMLLGTPRPAAPPPATRAEKAAAKAS